MQSVIFFISSRASKDQPNLSSDPEARRAMHAIIFLAYNHAIDLSPSPGSCKFFMSRTHRKLDVTWISPPLSLLDESLRSAIEKAAIFKMQEDLLDYVIKRAEEWETLMLTREAREIPGREWTPL